jgi:hypothetical protein
VEEAIQYSLSHWKPQAVKTPAEVAEPVVKPPLKPVPVEETVVVPHLA